MAFTEAANDLPVVGGVKFSGIAAGTATSSNLYVPRSMAAGDALAYTFVPACGLYLKNGSTADAGVNATGIASGKGIAATLFGASGTTPTFPNAAAIADNAAVPTTTLVGAVNLGYDGTTLDLLRTADLANGSAPTGVLASGTFLSQSGLVYRWSTAAAGADGGAGQGAGVVGVVALNGAGTWDKVRNNTTVTVLASAARTVATSTGALVNYNGRGIHCDLTVTAKAAATTITIQLLNAGGATIATSGTIAAAAGQAYSVAFYPGVLAAAYSGNGQGLSVLVPRDYILVVTPSDASSVTYSLNVLTQL